MRERFTVAGQESSVALTDLRSTVPAIASGPNHTFWFTDVIGGAGSPTATGEIGRLS
jgi:hypothetical protein